MAVVLADLKLHVGAEGTDYDNLLTDCLAEATVLVDKYIGSVTVPESIKDRAYLEVGADLWNRRQAPNGIATTQYATADGVGSAPIRIARDPMQAAYKILGRWVLPW